MRISGCSAQFAARHGELAPAARARLATGLAARLSAHPAPPGQSELTHLLALHTAELARRQGRLSARGTAGAGTRFAAQKRPRWDEFERLADRAARQGLDSFASHELPDFAARYREVAADLARARTYRADAATQSRLERLAVAGPQRALSRRARAPGAASGWCSRGSAPPPSSSPAGYVLARVPHVHRPGRGRATWCCTISPRWRPSCCPT